RAGGETAFTGLWIAPEWRRRGYGSYLLRQVLHRCGGYSREQASLFTAPLPAGEGEAAFWGKFGFVPEGDRLVRRRKPDLTAVRLAQDFLAAHLARPRLLVDATCGNGGDTAFLCRSEEHTSELQSRFELVCRLLLERRKTRAEYTK